jgi:hypothetical protein
MSQEHISRFHKILRTASDIALEMTGGDIVSAAILRMGLIGVNGLTLLGGMGTTVVDRGRAGHTPPWVSG